MLGKENKSIFLVCFISLYLTIPGNKKRSASVLCMAGCG